MNVLLMTIGAVRNIAENGAYTDLLRFFFKKGHTVYVVCSRERRQGMPTCVEKQDGIQILRVRIGNITKVNFIEKGISTLAIERQYEKALEKYFHDVVFDIVMYSTPPITLAGVVGRLKKKNGSFTYLMLKDIFPAGAVDLGVLRETGIKGLIYRYFRSVEKELYRNSEMIGCMSIENKRYLLENNPQILETKVEICPNTIDILKRKVVDRQKIRKKYKLPEDKLLLLYGGNFGLPQNVDFVVRVMEATKKVTEVHFVMCGSGTEFYKIKAYESKEENNNVTLINTLPYTEYKELLSVCDVGLLFLDYRFKVPNFPSRLLDYLNFELPVIAATDVHTDVGKTILEGDFGWWCESRNENDYVDMLRIVVDEWENSQDRFFQRGQKAKSYLEKNFRTEIAYNAIICSYYNWKGLLGDSND